MLNSLFAVLPLLATGSLFIITIVLRKGQICPGQRGRIHKMLPFVLIVWLLAAIQFPFVLINVFFVGFFISRVKMSKTRDSGPLYALYVANFLSFLIIMYQMISAPTWVSSCVVLLNTMMLGLIGAHWMLTFAKSRLQFFHKLLPIAGIFIAIALAFVLVPYALPLDEDTLRQLFPLILMNFSLLMTSILVWIWHLIATRPMGKLQISFASIFMLMSLVGFHQMYFHVI